MTDLKTLKDLEDDFHSPIIGIQDLRAEAIKWVKTGKSFTAKCLLDGKVEYVSKNLAVETWIMHFFNLSEEDVV